MISPNWMVGASTPEEKARREQLVSHGDAFLDLLAAVCRHQIDSLGSSPFSDYESSGWAFKEADRKGQVRALKNILSLCNHTDKE